MSDYPAGHPQSTQPNPFCGRFGCEHLEGHRHVPNHTPGPASPTIPADEHQAKFDQALAAQRAGRVVMETLSNGAERAINFDKRRERELAARLGQTSGRQKKKMRREIRKLAKAKQLPANPNCGVVGCLILEPHRHTAPPTTGGEAA